MGAFMHPLTINSRVLSISGGCWGKKEGYMAKKPGAQQIKKEKRDLHIEPAPARVSRRRFLTYLGTGSVALVAGSSGVLAGCAKSEEKGAANEGSPKETAQA